MRFEIGDEVTLKDDYHLSVGEHTILRTFPVFGRVYTIEAYPLQGHPHYQNWVSIKELGGRSVFDEEIFEALITDQRLAELIFE